jgi:hypothetical protein
VVSTSGVLRVAIVAIAWNRDREMIALKRWRYQLGDSTWISPLLLASVPRW